MLETKTFEELLDSILERVPDDFDKTPSSPIYIISAPNAKEIEILRQETDYGLEQIFPTTQDREHLVRDAETYGMAPYEPVKAIAEGEFDIDVGVGQRFSKDQMNFVTTEFIEQREDGDWVYKLECETAGEAGNIAPGRMVPIWTTPNLKKAYLSKIIVPGEESEETEVFRKRYLDSFIHKPFCGNVTDFLRECDAYEGVGRSKILRCRNPQWEIDPEFVGVVFTDSENKKPTSELVEGVQEYFHPLLGGFDKKEMMKTSGLGMAAIGQLVHVHGVEEQTVDVGLKLRFSAGYSWETLKPEIVKIIEEYFEGLRATWGEVLFTKKAENPMQDKIEVIRSQIESRILNIEGIIDSESMKLNGGFENFTCDWISIPVLGEVYEHEDSEHPDWGGCPCDCSECPVGGDMTKCGRIKEILNGGY